ncbi:hypothetical protein WJX79_000168 [Trebouxia sp. C0005]
MGLVDYSSDDEDSDAIDRSWEIQQPTGVSPGVATAAPAHLAPAIQSAQPAATSSTPAAILPDAASLFSSNVGSSFPWAASRQNKRVSTAGQTQLAKFAKTAASPFPSTQQHQQTRAASGVLLPPQLRGRANASTEDMERLGFARAKSAQKPKSVSQ